MRRAREETSPAPPHTPNGELFSRSFYVDLPRLQRRRSAPCSLGLLAFSPRRNPLIRFNFFPSHGNKKTLPLSTLSPLNILKRLIHLVPFLSFTCFKSLDMTVPRSSPSATGPRTVLNDVPFFLAFFSLPRFFSFPTVRPLEEKIPSQSLLSRAG